MTRSALHISYAATPTLARFHRSDAFVRGVMGPVGSGKSTAMCMEIFSRAVRQAKAHDGKRKSRWAVIRNTYRELKDTTLATWLSWFPEALFGDFGKTEMIHRLRFADVELDVLFRALDGPEDIKKVLSLELTGAWINEARELELPVVRAVADRVGRFPGARQGGPSFSGIIMDTNPPDTEHWWRRMAEDKRPEGWDFFRQPGGLILQGGRYVANPLAENLANLPRDYYLSRAAGNDQDHVRVYYAGEYGSLKSGKPVFADFATDLHAPETPVDADPSLSLHVGMDFGLTPAAVLGQRESGGAWRIIDEYVTDSMSVAEFGRRVKDLLNTRYQGLSVETISGDPAGNARSASDGRTCFEVLREAGLPAQPAPTNDLTTRLETVSAALRRLVDRKPGLVVSPRCKRLKKALSGGYRYRQRALASTGPTFEDRPAKDEHSHVADALQYLLLGAGESFHLSAQLAQDPIKPSFLL